MKEFIQCIFWEEITETKISLFLFFSCLAPLLQKSYLKLYNFFFVIKCKNLFFLIWNVLGCKKCSSLCFFKCSRQKISILKNLTINVWHRWVTQSHHVLRWDNCVITNLYSKHNYVNYTILKMRTSFNETLKVQQNKVPCAFS